jgi:hypothetical protein
MRAFKFDFPSMWLGGETIIIAKSYKEACEILKSSGILDASEPNYTCKDEKGITLTTSKIIHYSNGDY